MLSESHKSMFRTHGTMVGRMLLGLLFVVSGINILMGGVTGTAEFFSAAGVPMAGLAVWLVVAVKVIGGGFLMLGHKTEEAALALIIFTLGATWFGHMDPMDNVGIMKNLAIVGGLLYTIAYGPGQGWRLKL